jgi:hypothetical protein
MMENRNGLIVDAMLTQADGTAERDAGLIMAYQRWRDLPNSYGVEFAIGTVTFNEHDALRGFHVAIWNYGYGKNDTDARREWAKGMSIVHEFFEREIVAIPKQLYHAETTVSLDVQTSPPLTK